MKAVRSNAGTAVTTGSANGIKLLRVGLVGRVSRGVLVAACAALLLLFIVPVRPHFVSDELDASWVAALHVAFQQGLQFGSQFVFTFGPLGFAHTRTYWPGLYSITLAVWLAIGTAFIAAILQATRAAAYPTVGIAAITMLTCSAAIPAVDAVVFAYVLLVVWASRGEERPALTLLHGVTLGVLATTKLTFLIVGALAMAFLAAIRISRRRFRLAGLALLLYGATFLVLWLLCGQSPHGLIDFFLNGAEIVGGYTAAMGISGPRTEITLFLGLAVAVIAFSSFEARRARQPGPWLIAAFTILLLAIVFRQGFVRHDAHALTATFFLAIAGTLVFISARPARPIAAVLAVSLWAACIALLAYSIHRHFALTPASAGLELLGHLRAAAVQLVEYVAGRADLRARHDAAIERIRQASPLPPVTGSVDIYSYEQSAVFAHGLRWSPRPVIQSYSAYTPRLAELNAAHLRGRNAPANLLVAIKPIDERLPALEDGKSWLEMLRHYRSARSGVRWVHLERRAAAREVSQLDLGTFRASGWFGIASIEHDLLFASVFVDEPGSARIRAALLKPPQRWIELRLANGRTLRYRFIPRMAEAGFLLSPLIANTGDFAQLFECDGILPDRTTAAFRIVDRRGAEVPFEVRLRKLLVREVGTSDDRPRSTADAFCRIERIASPKAVFGEPLIEEGTMIGLNAHPPATFRVREKVRSIEVCTRMRQRAILEGESDGYVVRLVDREAGARELAARQVLPAEFGFGDKETCLGAHLREPSSAIEIHVEGGASTAWDWVYISRIAMEK